MITKLVTVTFLLGAMAVVAGELPKEKTAASVALAPPQDVSGQKQKYTLTLQNRYDGALNNSVVMAEKHLPYANYKIRNELGEFEFAYDGTQMVVEAFSSMACRWPEFGVVYVFVDHAFYQKVTIKNGGVAQYLVSLPPGHKAITIVEGLNGRPRDQGDVEGTFITGLYADETFMKIPIAPIQEKIVFLGDSILGGGTSGEPQLYSLPMLFRLENSKQVAVHGWGWARLFSFASDVEKINTTVLHFKTYFANVTGRKNLVLMIGTNDKGIDKTPAATFKIWYANLLDAVQAADAGINVYCVSPLARGDGGPLLDEYREAIRELCGTRAFTTYIDGKPILALPGDFTDGLHPTKAGYKKYKDAIYAVMYPDAI